MKPWIAVDLDGTLAEYHGWVGPEHIGNPVIPMVNRVCHWLAEGKEVRIFTARAGVEEQIKPVQEWCLKHIGIVLEITNIKDFGMIELWDDRAIRVIFNKGEPCCGK